MKKQRNNTSVKFGNESGIAVIEYALLLALLVMLVYAAVNWSSLLTAIQAVIGDVVLKINPS